jgi:hypothetical protein
MPKCAGEKTEHGESGERHLGDFASDGRTQGGNRVPAP